jgi:general secretion pathway protein D
MQIVLHRVVWVAGILVAAALTPAARAQGFGQPGSVPGPTFTTIRLQTTVTVPDGGTVTLGGYSRLSEGRTEFGAPVLGRGPYAGRGFRNVGYGRTAVSGRVTASVRIIDLGEEEFRQTGVRSR